MSRKGWLLFCALCVIWGIPYLLIRVAVRELTPAVLVFARTAPVALVMLPIALRAAVSCTGFSNAGAGCSLSPSSRSPCRGCCWVTPSSGCRARMAGLLVAAVPLIAAVLYRLSGTAEHLGGRRLAGLALGFVGVAALVGFDTSGGHPRAIAEVLVVALCYATGPLIISRRLADLPGLGVVVASLAITAVVYAPFALTHLPTAVSAETVAAVVTLALVCTALAFVLFFALIVEVGPTRATVITYVNPLVAVLLGVVFLGEPLHRRHRRRPAAHPRRVRAGYVAFARPAAARGGVAPTAALTPAGALDASARGAHHDMTDQPSRNPPRRQPCDRGPVHPHASSGAPRHRLLLVRRQASA